MYVDTGRNGKKVWFCQLNLNPNDYNAIQYAGTTERRHLKEQASGRPFVSAFINRFLRQNNYQADGM
jgi:hypothetical protein